MVVTRRGPNQEPAGPRRMDVNGSDPQEERRREEDFISDLFTKMIKISVIILATGVAYYYFYYESDRMLTLGSVRETIEKKSFFVKCSTDYDKEIKKFPGCSPTRCGRYIKDGLVTSDEARAMIKFVETALAYGGSDGGASILDMYSGALSKGDRFINLFALMESRSLPIITEEEFALFRNVKDRVKKEISDEFTIPQDNLYLTKPVFFSRMNTKSAKTKHDEYWRVHIDRENYESFDYTALVYLSDYGADFTGGRFIFVDKDVNKTVEPRTGRLSFFTSGSENPHHVEKLSSGTRYAVTISFTCDPSKAVPVHKIPDTTSDSKQPANPDKLNTEKLESPTEPR